MPKRVLKAGDIVRAARDQYSGIRFGALVRVVDLDQDENGPTVIVEALDRDRLPLAYDDGSWSAYQHELALSGVKYAKQANNFANRRG